MERVKLKNLYFNGSCYDHPDYDDESYDVNCDDGLYDVVIEEFICDDELDDDHDGEVIVLSVGDHGFDQRLDSGNDDVDCLIYDKKMWMTR